LWHKILQDSSFFLTLLSFDRDLAEQYRSAGCPVCGGALHSARYRRQPRGGPAGLPPDYELRESFCCSVEGCRRRLTPPSVRFLGRRVYFGVVVIVVSAKLHGITEKRAAAMRELVGVSRRTLHRWRQWCSGGGRVLCERIFGGRRAPDSFRPWTAQSCRHLLLNASRNEAIRRRFWRCSAC